MHGRVGDLPLIGVGLFLDNDVGAESTGSGEVIKSSGRAMVVEAMQNGATPQGACENFILRIKKWTKQYKIFRLDLLL